MNYLVIKTKKNGKVKMETPKSVTIEDFVCLGYKMYAFRCGDENKNKINVISKSYSKNIKFEEYKKRLDGEKYESECENYILRSVNHEMHLQQLKKSSLSIFDDRRNYLNSKQSLPWN